jgi:2'-hydroxyisoflavone reductase
MTTLLVLGGTGFVGPAVVDEARDRGWAVTVLNRGGRAHRPDVAAVRGDRKAGGLTAVADRTWDVVVDTWAQDPSAVRAAVRTLADRTDRYVYISSRSVYRWPIPAGADEQHPTVQAAADDGAGDAPDVGYARAKAGGEAAVVEAFGDRALLARAGLILGPREDVGRLPWWLTRVARGGPVLAPGRPDDGIQLLDVRDLATFVLDAVEHGRGGAYDLVSPVGHATMGGLLDACVAATGSDAELRWVDHAAVLAAGVEPWTQLPIWLPPGELHDALHASDVSKALGAGLRNRPVAETVGATRAWLLALGTPPAPPRDLPPVGLDPEVERRILASVSG